MKWILLACRLDGDAVGVVASDGNRNSERDLARRHRLPLRRRRIQQQSRRVSDVTADNRVATVRQNKQAICS